MNQEDIVHLRGLLRIHTRRLHELERQAAQLGLNTPPQISIEIEDIQQKIASVDRQIETNTATTSYLDGKNALNELKGDLDRVANYLQRVEIKESQVYKLFGIPVLTISRVVSRVLLTLLLTFGIGFTGFVLGAFTSATQTGSSLSATETALAEAQTIVYATQTTIAQQNQTEFAELLSILRTSQAERETAEEWQEIFPARPTSTFLPTLTPTPTP